MGESSSSLSDFVSICCGRGFHENGGFDREGEDVEDVEGAFASDGGEENFGAGGVERVFEHRVAEGSHGHLLVDSSETVEDHEGLVD